MYGFQHYPVENYDIKTWKGNDLSPLLCECGKEEKFDMPTSAKVRKQEKPTEKEHCRQELGGYAFITGKIINLC